MLDTAQTFYLTALWVALSVGFLMLLNYAWPAARRRPHNDVIGWQASILGMIYAVIIGFMLFAVWENFQVADRNADNEANALANLYEAANGLPAVQRDSIQHLAQQYAALVITREWPEMHNAQMADAGSATVQQFWNVLTHTTAQSAGQQASLRQAMSELSSLSQHRRIRRLEARTAMPTILWTVLVLGGALTVVVTCLIGSEQVRLQFALIISLSLLISVTLMAIGDIDRPFQGAVHINPSAFERAQTTMQQSGLP